MNKRYYCYLLIIFIFAHSWYFLLGIRFDARPLNFAWQFLDVELLKNHLWESCFYLHSQPPLFNLFLGGILKLFPERFIVAFYAVYLTLGYWLYVSLFTLQSRLGISKSLALVLYTLFMVSPSFILYEHWLFYTFPTAFFLTLSALFFSQMLANMTWRSAFVFFCCLGVLSGMRSTFHLVHYCSVLVLSLLSIASHRKKLLISALIPFILIFGIYFKNFVLFETFSSSTWLGMNFWNTTVENMPTAQRKLLIAEKQLSPLALIDRFSPLEVYPLEYQVKSAYPHVSALTQIKKSTSGYNYTHIRYIAISKAYLKDDLYVLRHFLQYVLKGLLHAWFYYFKSSSDYSFLTENRTRVSAINAVYDIFFYGKLPCNLSQLSQWRTYLGRSLKRAHYVYIFLLIDLLFLVLYGWFASRHQSTILTLNQRRTLLYLCFNILYVALIGNLFEVGENHRFRFVTDPFTLTLLGIFMQHDLFPRVLSSYRQSRKSLKGKRICSR